MPVISDPEMGEFPYGAVPRGGGACDALGRCAEVTRNVIMSERTAAVAHAVRVQASAAWR